MYIAVTGSKNNKDIYIYQSFRKKTENHPLVFIRSLENTTPCWNSLMVIMKNLWLGQKAKLPKKPNFTMNAPGKLRLNSLKLPAFLWTRHVLFMPVIYFFNNYVRSYALITSAVWLKGAINLSMIFMRFWLISFTQVFSLLQASSAVIIFAKRFLNHQSMRFRMFTELYL